MNYLEHENSQRVEIVYQTKQEWNWWRLECLPRHTGHHVSIQMNKVHYDPMTSEVVKDTNLGSKVHAFCSDKHGVYSSEFGLPVKDILYQQISCGQVETIYLIEEKEDIPKHEALQKAIGALEASAIAEFCEIVEETYALSG